MTVHFNISYIWFNIVVMFTAYIYVLQQHDKQNTGVCIHALIAAQQ